MKELLLNYFYRFRKYKMIYAVLGIYILSLLIYLLVTSFLFGKDNTGTIYYMVDTFTMTSIFMHPLSMPCLTIPIFIILFLSLDYKYDTFRNMILAGKKRIEIYLSALIVSLIFTIASILILYGLSTIISSAFGYPLIGKSITGLNTTTEQYWLTFIAYFVGEILICSLACFLAMTIRNRIASISIFIAVYLVLQGTTTISNIGYIVVGNSVINLYQLNEFFFSYQLNKIRSGYYDYVDSYYAISTSPLTVSYEVISGRKLPLLLKTFMSDAILIGLFNVLGCLLFNNKDLR